MKKKLIIVFFICVIIWIASLFVNIWLFLGLTILGSFLLLTLLCFLAANKLVKRTNWWKNKFVGTEQFVSGAGYRDNTIRNYDVINLGSNPARYAFFYEDVKGQSWATGSQGVDMDLEILRLYHSYLKEGGIVLIPIMPFTSISPFLKERQEYWGVDYYLKFAKILDSAQVSNLPYGHKLMRYLSYPLLYDIKSIRYIFRDVLPNYTYLQSEQNMMTLELEADAAMWIKNWKKEFRLKSLYDVLEDSWTKYYDEAIDTCKTIVDFCIERNLRPILICVPMTSHLANLFPEKVRKYLVTDFVKKVNVHNVPFLDYTADIRFVKDEFYINSFFMNLRGRKLFTHQVLSDIGLIN